MRRKLWISTVILSLSASFLAGGVIAAEAGKGKPDKGQHQEKKKHNHHHQNGHAALGEKLKQNGKHEVGKVGNHTVIAEVSNGKVKNMSAEGTAVKRVKTKQKMASLENGLVLVSADLLHLVQYNDYYYGYCFDDGVDLDCYWYPAEDVDYADYSWDDYDPYY